MSDFEGPKYGARSANRNNGRGIVPSHSRDAHKPKIHLRSMLGLPIGEGVQKSIYRDHYERALKSHNGNGVEDIEVFNPSNHYTHKKYEDQLLTVDGEIMSVLSVNAQKRQVVLITPEHKRIEKKFTGKARFK